MVLEISQDDLNIMAAAVHNASASLSSLMVETIDGRIQLSGVYSRLFVEVRFRAVCGLRVWSEDTIAVDIEEAMLGPLLHLSTSVTSRLVAGFLQRYALEGGVSAKGSSLLIRLDRLRLPFPLSLMNLSLREITLAPGLIRIVSY